MQTMMGSAITVMITEGQFSLVPVLEARQVLQTAQLLIMADITEAITAGDIIGDTADTVIQVKSKAHELCE